jgi:hypothetical protein
MSHLVAVLMLVLLSACGQTRVTVDDDRPPPFRDDGFQTFWSTDDPDRPTEEMLVADIVEFRLPLLLLPADQAGSGVGTVSLEVSNSGFDVFVSIAVSSAEAGNRIEVLSSNTMEAVACGPAGVPIVIRGSQGCFGPEEPGQLLLSWEEEWIHQARWTQDPGQPSDQLLDSVVDWLNTWRVLRP